jgi:hypothetical protein
MRYQVKDAIELERKLAAALDRPVAPLNRNSSSAAAVAGMDDDEDEDEDGNGLDRWGPVSFSSGGSGSVTYSTYGDSASDEDGDFATLEGGGDLDDDDDYGGGAQQQPRGAIAVQEARKQLRSLQSGASRTDALVKLLGGRLACKHAGRLSHGGSACAFVPRYLADPLALAPPVRLIGSRKWPGM